MRKGSRLVGLVAPDLCGFLRGRFVAESELAIRTERGVGWVPANIAMTPFGVIPPANPFGSLGDLRLRLDPSTRASAEFAAEASPLDLILCDQVEPDGSDWDCCPRTLARSALALLHERTGLSLRASFEYEFQLVDGDAGPPFSVDAMRAVDPFGPVLHDALEQAGCEPELIIAEYGPGQFEVPCSPTMGLAAADRAAIVRAIVRESARACGYRASFAPLLKPDAVGSGAHLHFSLVDDDGASATEDLSAPAGLSTVAAQFAAGIIAHAPALCTFFAPLSISYLRLRPGHWSSAGATMRVADREAFLRVCPRAGQTDTHLELRAADASSSPYLVLAMVVMAGLSGIDAQTPLPSLEAGDEEQNALPTSLSEALVELERDAVARTWLSPRLLETYTTLKRAELEAVAALDDAAACDLYATVY